ncbi:MAG TPA: VOC family protein [Ferruginibacter sp.]|nr:VOC family protein [Ferruginibacter sp.]
MKKVTSIGGIFFKSNDPKKINEWYQKHLGINTDEYGTSFEWRHAYDPGKKGFTVWSPFKETTDYFAPSEKGFMINFRVEDLEALLAALKSEGIEQLGETQVYEYGKFAHIMDPEGNKLELWEANDEEYDKMIGVRTK